MKLFGLETIGTGVTGYVAGSTVRYRWYSKFNGARGPWESERSKAVAGGKEHEEIIRSISMSSLPSIDMNQDLLIEDTEGVI